MNDRLGGALFAIVDRWRGERILEKLEGLERSERWSRLDLEAFRARQLTAIVRHAARSVPFYREIFAGRGLDPERFTIAAELARLPVVERDDIIADPQRFIASDPGGPARWDVTSGSTGTPLRFLRSLEANGLHRALNMRALSWYGVRPGARQARFWGVPIRPKDRLAERVKDAVLNRVRYSAFAMDERSIAASLTRLARHRPRYLYGYPSAIHAYALQLLANGREVLEGWRPALVMTTAEMLFPDQERDIAAAFQAPVCNEYGASELTMIAASCPAGGMHVSAEAVIIEFEKTDLEVDGKAAYRMLFTDLTNRVMPMIRYRLGDLGRSVEEPCACGRALPRIEIMGGREVDLIRTPSGRRVHGSVFSYLGKSILIAGGVRRFRATQTRPDLIEVEIERGPTFRPDCLEAMRAELDARLNGEVAVRFDQVREIVPEASGKLRYFRTLLAPADRGPDSAPSRDGR